MSSNSKIIGWSLLAFAGVLILAFVMGLYGLGWKKFFKPKEENIDRQVFEQTQSFVHGKIQDLARYYDEYNRAEEDEKEAIRQTIIIRFAEFDESKVSSMKLRQFLITMRGY